MPSSEELDAQSAKGKAILTHAFSGGGKVLEFRRTDDGELKVADVTEHHRALQDYHDENHAE